MSCHGDARVLSLIWRMILGLMHGAFKYVMVKRSYITSLIIYYALHASPRIFLSEVRRWCGKGHAWRMVKCSRVPTIDLYSHRKAYKVSEIQCIVQCLCWVLRAAIEELLLPGAGAEQRDTLRTFDSLEEASTEHYLEDRTLYWWYWSDHQTTMKQNASCLSYHTTSETESFCCMQSTDERKQVT